MIMNSVLAGSRGGEVVMMDMGRQMGEAHVGMPHRIPYDVLPEGMTQAAKHAAVRCSIPDGFMYKPLTAQNRARYTVVEFKFCKDTDPSGQLSRASMQHADLVHALQLADPVASVDFEIILIGVSGAIYSDHTKAPLLRLGVAKGAWDKLKYKMHLAAVQQLHWIYTSKLAQECIACPGVRGARGTNQKCRQRYGLPRGIGKDATPVHRKRKDS
jgi:hypothetical protein